MWYAHLQLTSMCDIHVAGLQAPFTDRPEYTECERLAAQLADLLAPQSGAYYDVWLDGEKFVSAQMEVCHTLQV